MVAAIIWAKGLALCPRCGWDQTTFREDLQRWECRSCHLRFSVNAGTVFQCSHISIAKWLAALLILLANAQADETTLTKALDLSGTAVSFMMERFRNPVVPGKPTTEIKLPKYRTRKTRSSKAVWEKSLDRLRRVIYKRISEEFANVYIETLRGLLHGQALQLPREHAMNAGVRKQTGSSAFEKKRRKRRSLAEIREIAYEASLPEASVRITAAVYGVTANQIYGWRKLLSNGKLDDHYHNDVHSE